MKRIINAIATGAFLAFFTGAALLAGKFDFEYETNLTNARISNYANTAMVVGIDYGNNELVLMDEEGKEWTYSGIAGFREGDLCSFLATNNGTMETKDDTMVSKLKYSGNIDDLANRN